jgi:hypothetical protein
MSAAKNLSSTLFSWVIAGIPLMTALLSIGSAQARNDGFKEVTVYAHPPTGISS